MNPHMLHGAARVTYKTGWFLRANVGINIPSPWRAYGNHLLTLAGSWFGTFSIFHILGISSSRLTFIFIYIFQRGRYTTDEIQRPLLSLSDVEICTLYLSPPGLKPNLTCEMIRIKFCWKPEVQVIPSGKLTC